jgi:hypothetical protein
MTSSAYESGQPTRSFEIGTPEALLGHATGTDDSEKLSISKREHYVDSGPTPEEAKSQDIDFGVLKPSSPDLATKKRTKKAHQKLQAYAKKNQLPCEEESQSSEDNDQSDSWQPESGLSDVPSRSRKRRRVSRIKSENGGGGPALSDH